MGDLKLLDKKCHTTALTEDEHRNLLISDAFVAGICTNNIRQRLLESSEDTLDNLYKTALTMELAIADAHSIGSHDHPPQLIAVARSQTGPCMYCGWKMHKQKSMCPANGSTCSKCHKKNHWAKVCRSSSWRASSNAKSAAVNDNHSDDDDEDTQLSSILSAATDSPSPGLVNVRFNDHPIKALIDTGSDNTFIKQSFLYAHKITYDQNYSRCITLANQSQFHVVGKLTATIISNDSFYNGVDV